MHSRICASLSAPTRLVRVERRIDRYGIPILRPTGTSPAGAKWWGSQPCVVQNPLVHRDEPGGGRYAKRVEWYKFESALPGARIAPPSARQVF